MGHTGDCPLITYLVIGRRAGQPDAGEIPITEGGESKKAFEREKNKVPAIVSVF